MVTLLASWFPFADSEDGEPTADDGGETVPEDVDDISERDLHKQIFKTEQQLDRIEDDINRRKEQYLDYLRKGADAPPERRRVYAVRARLEKFKVQIQEVERLKMMKQLSAWVTIKGQRDLKEMMEDFDQNPDPTELIDLDVSEFQAKVDEVQSEIDYEMQQIDELMQQAEIDLGDTEVSLTEEQKLMDQLASGEAEVADIDMGLGPVDDESSIDSEPQHAEQLWQELDSEDSE